MFPIGRRSLSFLGAIGALMIATACSDDNSSGGGGGGGATTSTFVGILSSDDATESGSLEVTVATASPTSPVPTGDAMISVGATGTVSIVGGSATALTGTYDDATGALAVNGGGYSFTGNYDGSNRLEGTYTGPGTTGIFVTAQDDGTTAAYCGSYAGDDQGVWNFVIDGSALLGQAVSSLSGTGTPLDGSINGNAITVLFPGTQQTLATGTRNGSSVSGTWADPNSTDQGTWSGTLCP